MNIDEHPAIPGQMGIQSIPAVIAFVNGQPDDGLIGALPEGQVSDFIARIIKEKLGGQAQDLLKTAEDMLAAGNAVDAIEIYNDILAEQPRQIVKRDRKWNEDGARKQLVQFFDAWGPADEATVNGRRKLSSVLFS